VLIVVAVVVQLRGTAKDVGFQTSLLKQAFVADAGWPASVPPEVMEAKALLAQHSDAQAPIALGAGLKDDPLLLQRMWEGLYPLRLHDADGGRMLFKAGAPERAGCTVIARSEHVVLADCL
jgi:hypothetical protein